MVRSDVFYSANVCVCLYVHCMLLCKHDNSSAHCQDNPDPQTHTKTQFTLNLGPTISLLKDHPSISIHIHPPKTKNTHTKKGGEHEKNHKKRPTPARAPAERRSAGGSSAPPSCRAAARAPAAPPQGPLVGGAGSPIAPCKRVRVKMGGRRRWASVYA